MPNFFLDLHKKRPNFTSFCNSLWLLIIFWLFSSKRSKKLIGKEIRPYAKVGLKKLQVCFLFSWFFCKFIFIKKEQAFTILKCQNKLKFGPEIRKKMFESFLRMKQKLKIYAFLCFHSLQKDCDCGKLGMPSPMWNILSLPNLEQSTGKKIVTKFLHVFFEIVLLSFLIFFRTVLSLIF